MYAIDATYWAVIHLCGVSHEGSPSPHFTITQNKFYFLSKWQLGHKLEAQQAYLRAIGLTEDAAIREFLLQQLLSLGE